MSRRGGGRGKPSHKGRRRHFTDAEELKAQMERDRREKEWRENRGEVGSDEEKSGTAEAEAKAESSDEETSSDEEVGKPKGVSGLIEIENPNRVAAKMKKVKDLEVDGEDVQLTRREREELARQRAKEREIRLQLEGKTDQAKADLARLALIRKQREDAAKKRDAEKKVKDEAIAGGRGRGGKR